MKTIVVSAVNLNIGGTLTILRECLSYLSGLSESGEYRVIALVYKKELAFYPNIEYIEMQWPKKAWVNRLWCEYVTMNKISKQLSPVFLWFSLHDTTPSVQAERRVVYCHNSFPFYKWKLNELFFAPKVVLFALFSKYAYQKNIHQNKYIVVQQLWFKEQMVRLFKLDRKKVIIAPPSFTGRELNQESTSITTNHKYTFFFAAAPDSHKNFECICRAAQCLEKERNRSDFRVCITMNGTENAYARWIDHKWGKKIKALEFIGYLDKESLYRYYGLCNCFIFPSKIETWGLPVTEFGAFSKPMLLADLPYAHETAAGLSQVAFFNPDLPEQLAVMMEKMLLGDSGFLSKIESRMLPSPVVYSWKELFDYITK
jgi:glycosyltransferase involved in cell wall biosynthesis